jgi:hypothetical protein
MYIPFDLLPVQSRIWIYQSERPFQLSEENILAAQLKDFCEKWEAHQQPLQASFQILHNRFIVLAVNEVFNQASGCSIDKSARLIQEFEQILQQSLTNRTLVVIENSQKELKTIALKDIPQSVADGTLTPDSLIFNNLVQNIEEFRNNWKTTAKNTWLNRYFLSTAK